MDATQTPEEWRPIRGYEGAYEVSNHGRVRSLDHIISYANGHDRPTKGRVLTPWITRRYLTVRLGAGRRTYVHTFVCEAFHGPRPEPEWQVRHLNGDCLDNRAENLAWGTCSENHLDKRAHGTAKPTPKAECVNGHPFDEANTRWGKNMDGSPRRHCRACARVAGNKHYAKVKTLGPVNAPVRGPLQGPKTLRSSVNRDKAECLRGHPFNEENTYRIDGRRCCRACNAAAQRRRKERISRLKGAS